MEERLNTGLEEFDFFILRDSRGPNFLEFYARSPSHAFSGVKILSAPYPKTPQDYQISRWKFTKIEEILGFGWKFCEFSKLKN